MLQLSNYAFDGSTFDIYGALLNGSALIMVSKEDILAVDTLSSFILSRGITVFFLTTALFNALVDLGLEGLRNVGKILFGGQQISLPHTGKALEYLGKGRLIHVYGPTETTVYATYHNIDWMEKGARTVPIGKPIANTAVYLLDKYHQPVPIGVVGELYIGGAGNARGYLNRPELTAEIFPWVDLFGERAKGDSCLYRTGDLGRRLRDGSIEFMGRIDLQVKIRGFRIEPGEIEFYLTNHPGVREAVVQVKETSDDKYLCAYYVSERGQDEGVDSDALREYLGRYLPLYMTPAYFIPLDGVPLTPNGKVDTSALPDPGTGVELGKSVFPPRDDLERALAGIWSELLGRETMGIDDNFFQLGGHSLKATILSARIHKALSVKVPLAEIFRTPSIRGLACYIRSGSADGEVYSGIPQSERKEFYRLSSAQKRLYILQQMDVHNVQYNMPQTMYLGDGGGLLDGDNLNKKGQTGIARMEGLKQKLEAIFEQLMRRHESLRTSFSMIDDEPVQVIHDEVPLDLECAGDSGEGSDRVKGGEKNINYEKDGVGALVRPFDLSRAPLMRAVLLGGEKGDYFLFIDLHHIISDGTSQEILKKEFLSLYNGESLDPPVLALQYRDYAIWQNSPGQREVVAGQEAFWLSELSGDLPVLDLPADFRRPEVHGFEGSSIGFYLGEKINHSLETLAREHEVTVFMVLLAVTKIWLFRLSGQEDIIVGTPVAGRRHADLEGIMGMFVNTLPLRSFPADRKTAAELLEEIKKLTLAAFENQEYPFEELVEKLRIPRDVARNPVFDVLLTLQESAEVSGRHSGGGGGERDEGKRKEGELIYGQRGISRFDLTLACSRTRDDLLVTLEYSTGLFKEETVERFVGYFRRIITAVMDTPDMQAGAVEILSDAERKQLLEDFNGQERDYPADKTIYQLFTQQAAMVPDGVVLIDKESILTYSELAIRACRLACFLIGSGVKRGDIVPLMLDASLDMVVGVLGILAAGAAYLPIEPGYPSERKAFLLADAGARVLLTGRTYAEGMDFDHSILLIEDSREEQRSGNGDDNGGESCCTGEDALHWECSASAEDFAYVIYTSGTTGRPKGVAVRHRNVVNTLWCRKEVYELSYSCRSLQLFSFSFDGFVAVFFTPLISGAPSVLMASEEVKNIDGIREAIIKNGITHFICVPPLFQAVVDGFAPGDLDTLNSVTLAGDSVSEKLLEESGLKYPNLELVNEYGVTEAAVMSTMCRHQERHWVSIGSPTWNTRVLILDNKGKLLPIGVRGELYIGGAGVSAGYLNKPDLTAEKFVSIDFLPGLFYRTGDLGRWLGDGTIQFAGRDDFQVKIRGFRIELGEIENRLRFQKDVKEAVVLSRRDAVGESYLCAYVVPALSGEGDAVGIGVSVLKEHLSRVLPDYMVPAHIVVLEQLPVTSTGKLDRRALPEPLMESSDSYRAPRDEVEERLVELWSEILTGAVGTAYSIDDNFFGLGGHSLRATVLAAKIREVFDAEVQLTEVFKNPTVRDLAVIVRQREAAGAYRSIERAPESDVYAMASVQRRMYLMQVTNRGNLSYNMPLVVELEGALDRDGLESALWGLMDRHESFRTAFILVDGVPMQKILESSSVPFKMEDFGKHESGALKGLVEGFIRPFDLAQPPLMRVGLIGMTEHRHLLMLDMHHIIFDGTSANVFFTELLTLYKGEELEPLNIQYKDFAHWLNHADQQQWIKGQEAYWLERFGKKPRVLELPLDYPRPKVKSLEGDQHRFVIDGQRTAGLNGLAREEGTTLFMVLLALCNVFLSKLSGQQDIVIGTSIAGRRHPDLHGIIGMFVNALPLRNYPTADKTFKQFLHELSESTLNAYENQDYPFEELVEKVAGPRDPGRNPLFDVMFVLNNEDEITEYGVPGLRIKPFGNYELSAAQMDLKLRAKEIGDSIFMFMEYSTNLFKKESVLRFEDYFMEVLDNVLECPKGSDLLLGDIKVSIGFKSSSIDILAEDDGDFEF